MSEISRRDILAVGATSAVLTVTASQAAAQGVPASHAKGGQSLSNPGPQNPLIDKDNPSAFNPPTTDKGDMPNFKYSFNKEFNRQQSGGWARQVTVKDFPISKQVAGVNMRLEEGAIRELHWHIPAEWAYVLSGTCRITAVDQNGNHFAADVHEGDLWYFPSGVPHSLQGVGPGGTEFLLAFDDGAFSEDDTLLITDWMTHTPKDVLAKNFGVPASTFDNVPKEELYIFPAASPGALSADLAQSRQPIVPEPFNFSLMAQTPIKTAGGTVRIADSTNFKASKTMAAALVEVNPGAMRELHWHPTADEWQYYISGHGRMTVFKGAGRAHTEDFTAGDVGYINQGDGHYIENTGSEPLRFLEIFKSPKYADVSLAQWMANSPKELVRAHLHLPDGFLESLPESKRPVVG
ncbi:MAG: oxalate decarboxylase family bicupin [Caulobacteraceae bacterium]